MKKKPSLDHYQAQDDAHTLHRAGEIMGDKSRLSAAQAHVQNMTIAVQWATKPRAPRTHSLGFAKMKKL